MINLRILAQLHKSTEKNTLLEG